MFCSTFLILKKYMYNNIKEKYFNLILVIIIKSSSSEHILTVSHNALLLDRIIH